MQIKLWNNFNKRRNSTKQPAAASAIEKSVVLKENTSVENPTFLMTSAEVPEWNYAQAFGHYYFITDIVSTSKNQWEIRCEQDVLATHKSAIGSTNAHIVYGSVGYDPFITDSRLSMKSSKVIDSASKAFDILSTYQDDAGTYILTVANDYTDPLTKETGFCQQYAVNSNTMRKISNFLMTTDSVKEALRNEFNDPFSAIVSCIWIPFSKSVVDGYGASKFIRLGDQEMPVPSPSPSDYVDYFGRALYGTPIFYREYDIDIPWPHSDFRDFAPYTTATLTIPMYGNIEVNLSDYYGSSKLWICTAVDFSTGEVTIQLKNDIAGVKRVMHTLSFQTAVQCPIAQVTVEGASRVSSAIGMVGSAGALVASVATGNVLTGGAAVLGLVSSINSGVSAANQRHISTKGSVGGRSVLAFGKNFTLTLFIADTEEINDAYITKNGLPVMSYGNVSAHGGYVQCSDASVSLGSLASDRDAVNSFLNSGFYYE